MVIDAYTFLGKLVIVIILITFCKPELVTKAFIKEACLVPCAFLLPQQPNEISSHPQHTLPVIIIGK